MGSDTSAMPNSKQNIENNTYNMPESPSTPSPLKLSINITSSGGLSGSRSHKTPRSPKTPHSPLSPTSLTIFTRTKSFNIEDPYDLKTAETALCFENIDNGVTNKFISSKIASIAAEFWINHIELLSIQDQLEVAVAIYFGMIVSDKDTKSILKKNLKHQSKVEKSAVKFLNMFGWLIRSLMTNDIDLYPLLTKLGLFHRTMGISIKHFNPMLKSMHETFSYYFPTKYQIQVKYAMDKIFHVAAKIMMGKNLNTTNIGSTGEDNTYLQSLDVCLKSEIGRNYLFRYLEQTWCDEIAIYLQSIAKFNNQTNDKGRFMIARNIVSTSIDSKSKIPINISHETREIILMRMVQYEKQFLIKEEFIFDTKFFADSTREIYKLIIDGHWRKFVQSIQSIK